VGRGRYGSAGLAAMLLVAGACVPTKAMAGVHVQVVVTTVTVHGLTLALEIPGRTFPRGALIRARLTLVNHRHQSVSSGVKGCSADGPEPVVDVLSLQGRLVFPPALRKPPLSGAACFGPAALNIMPGEQASEWIYVLLRGPRVRAHLSLVGVASLATPTLRVRLSPRDAPRVAVHPGKMTVDVSSDGTGSSRPWYYSDWYVCKDGSSDYVAGTTFREYPPQGPGEFATYTGIVMDWEKMTGGHFAPACSKPVEWHIAIAHLGESPAYVTLRHSW